MKGGELNQVLKAKVVKTTKGGYMKKVKEEMVTYLIEHENGIKRKITVPESWKVTFGPAVKGNRANSNPHGPKMPMALRFYESDTKQRAIFTDVVSFRDMSIKIEEEVINIQEKDGYYECEGKKKRTTFQAKTREWVNPDAVSDMPLLPKDSTVFNTDEG